MIHTIQYRFQIMTRLLIHQTGSLDGPPNNYVPLWMGQLPTIARPSADYMSELWKVSQKLTPPETVGPHLAHYAAPFQVDCEDSVQLQKVPGNRFRISWPRWYVEAIKAGAITGWDDTRISREVLTLFGLPEAP